jgi:hypothetical protein
MFIKLFGDNETSMRWLNISVVGRERMLSKTENIGVYEFT